MTLMLALMSAMAFLIFNQMYTTLPETEDEHPAWPRNKTRDIKVYVLPDNPTTIHEPNTVCDVHDKGDKWKLPLLIVVHSAVNHFDARKRIRETWGDDLTYTRLDVPKKSSQFLVRQVLKYHKDDENDTKTGPHGDEYERSDFKVIFILGLPLDDSLQGFVNEEASKYGDILQQDFIDTYYNLSIKSTMMLKWLTSDCYDKVMYALKTDDDADVKVSQLLTTLIMPEIAAESQETSSKKKYKKKYELYGSLECNTRRFTDVKHKLYLPKYMYRKDTYPCYSRGSGYLFTMPVAHALYKAAMKTPLVPYEDLYITGLCRENAKPYISITHDTRIALFTKIPDDSLYTPPDFQELVVRNYSVFS